MCYCSKLRIYISNFFQISSLIKYNNIQLMQDQLNFGVKLNSQPSNVREPDNKVKYNQFNQQKPSKNQENMGDLNVKKGDYDLSEAAHPIACIFTFLFKALAIVIYFLGGFVFNSSILIFILVIILSALDFWTVKNVTGRLLVGLRWWSDYDEKGKQIWKFQSYEKQFNPNPVDSTFFWTSQLGVTGFWAVMCVIKILSLSFYWVLLVGICLTLSLTNLYGYYKCRGQYSKKLGDIQSKLKQQGMNKILKNIF